MFIDGRVYLLTDSLTSYSMVNPILFFYLTSMMTCLFKDVQME